MPSLSYHFIRAILKLMGVKKAFSSDPMDYKKLRKGDLSQPSKRMLRGNKMDSFNVLNSTITILTPPQAPQGDYLLLYCPGGAFVSGPGPTAWDSLATLVKRTGVTGWLVNYPKAPEHHLAEVATNLDAIYTKALEQYAPEHIILMGDSAGGHVVITLIQRLLEKGLPLPQQLIAVCPLLDLSADNPAMAAIDPLDPMLSVVGIRSSNCMAQGDLALKEAAASPLFGNFEGFPPVAMFLAEHDVLYPDGLLAVEKMKAAGVAVQVIVGEKMPHSWPFLPFMKEAVAALEEVEGIIVEGLG